MLTFLSAQDFEVFPPQGEDAPARHARSFFQLSLLLPFPQFGHADLTDPREISPRKCISEPLSSNLKRFALFPLEGLGNPKSGALTPKVRGLLFAV